MTLLYYTAAHSDVNSVLTQPHWYYFLAILQILTVFGPPLKTGSIAALRLLAQFILFALSASFLGNGYFVLVIGGFPIFVMEILYLFKRPQWLLILMLIFQISFIAWNWLHYGARDVGWLLIRTQLLVSIFFGLYWFYYSRLVRQKVMAQHLAEELQIANQQVKSAATRDERERIARDLHDTVMQDVAGVAMQLEALQRIDKQDAQYDAIFSRVLDLSHQTIRDGRQTLSALRQTHMKATFNERITLLLETMAHNYQLNVSDKLPLIELVDDKADELLRTITEALLNITKHTQTHTALLKGQIVEDELVIQVIDFGQGFNVQKGRRKQNHFGLTSMYERMAQLGGRVEIDSAIDEGTTVTLFIPIGVVNDKSSFS
ncbi:MAG TPA: sensor histidine kinase [Lactobacillaceae bacterium]